jgi:hypothetical protein
MGNNDPRAVDSRLAVAEAIAWYAARLGQEPRAPIDALQFDALRAVLDGSISWRDELFEPFINFGRFMHRAGETLGDAPRCNVGDVLTALGDLPPGTAWSHDYDVDPTAFEKFGFRTTSTRTASVEAQHRAGWAEHGQQSRAFINGAAPISARRELAIVLGVGHAFDLPLVELARSFERVLLVDIDAVTLDAAAAALEKEPGLRARIETRVVDLTGINGRMVRDIDELAAQPGDAAALQARLELLARSYRPGASGASFWGERADLVVSACVATQLSWPQRSYALRVLERDLGPMSQAADQRWSHAWFEFELRLQQRHIADLAAMGALVLLISDMVNHVTGLDAAGNEQLSGRRVFTMGVNSLSERVPRSLEVAQSSRWLWPRYRPNGRVPGSIMEVHALALREPPGAQPNQTP